ncbi:3-phosphoshikimate 1-carboxyvinyltransferase [Peptostreptococcus porci]|uniref:3-phosphoshikimate 1-carboxyvinyltransferase n=1 Tax=Peptostreptococcus porci TaxID=2652282 RepID=UPI0023EF67F5|nr:3-phosphoshikimate 1-carboxyvinyltransferase [Peptostreptococcus porci]MDD7183718.1 3-phosphoshikimate 1-carboxyvinyltransferase [Peptostreptococcus porci]MDY5963618.1 3-phosphoshikimate 1-carboxyvinyltransferase [Peptostreptococcus porci]
MRVKPSKLEGSVKAIPSKSFAHRALICAAISDGVSQIIFDKTSDDIDATINCLRTLGAKIEKFESGVRVQGISKLDNIPIVDSKESGSTFRFLLPLASTIYGQVIFIGEGRLPSRPIKDLMDVMKHRGVEFDSECLPFKTNGLLSPGRYEISGDVSSQYVSGLLFAALNLNGSSEVIVNTNLESKSYVYITVEVMRAFGADIIEKGNSFLVNESKLKARSYNVEGDWSNSSFLLVAGAFGKVSVNGLNKESSQGDKQILKILEDFGAEVVTSDEITVASRDRNPIDVDLKDIPDMLPILSILAASVDGGVSRFYNVSRLRLKESDRIKSTADLITSLGGKVEERDDELLIYGTNGLAGGIVDSHNDHRIVMAAAIASTISENDIVIKNSKAINKSYPTFFDDFADLGGKI